MKKLLLLLLLPMLSCNRGLEQETLDKYKGGVIYEKIGDASLQQRPFLYVIKINDEMKTVNCYEAEFTYNLRDTIK
jgi:hypothetical protein